MKENYEIKWGRPFAPSPGDTCRPGKAAIVTIAYEKKELT
jgi:hypothetical protein